MRDSDPTLIRDFAGTLSEQLERFAASGAAAQRAADEAIALARKAPSQLNCADRAQLVKIQRRNFFARQKARTRGRR